MRISDWSSDVCSSDLGMASDSADVRDFLDFIERGERPLARWEPGFGIRDWGFAKAGLDVGYGTRRSAAECSGAQRPWPLPCRIPNPESRIPRQSASRFAPARPPATCSARDRSEEHTSELQPLMRISYAVICLKKKQCTTCRVPVITVW